MEARSLASLNFLAANPPQYPVNPSETRQEPLTLYISRVPGTRDVILSPFKPQLKNVTAEDVASSLYYVHLDTTATEGVSRNNRSSDEGSPSRRAIPRKPIPGNEVAPVPPVHSSSDSTLRAPEQPGFSQSHLSPRSSMDYQPISPTTQRSPVSNSYPSPGGSTQYHEYQQQLPSYGPTSPVRDGPPLPPRSNQTRVPPRKPVMNTSVSYPASPTVESPSSPYGRTLPTTPEPFSSSERGYDFSSYPTQTSRPSTGRASYLEFEEARRGLQPQAQAPNPSLVYPDDSTRIASQVYEADYPVPSPQPGRVSPNRFTRSPSPTKKQKDSFFTLHLIRRDPSSGNQWNVGRVSSQQLEGSRRPSASDENTYASPPPVPGPSSSARPPIDIQIETSGYAKFRHMPMRRSMDTTRTPDAATVASLMRDTTPPTGDEAGFSRTVQMSYSKSWTSSIKEKWNKMERNAISSRQQGHSRNTSTVSVASASSASPPPPTTTLGQAGPGMKPRGYVFTSPWDGRCDFRTGNAGRSLRCHHVIHEGQSAGYNPLVAEQESALTPSNGASSVVSELRFNLPSAEIFSSDDPEKRGRGAHQRLGSLGKFWKRGADDDGFSDDEDEVSPFDLNVGRERAGGGNRGSRAKLGKLIVYNDGLKMLDLIVAANIGVWWGTWERSF